MPRLSVCLLLICLCLPAGSALAFQDDELEGWQKRILEALEEADGRGENPNAGQADRQSYSGARRSDEASARAAEEARRRYGGQALAVVPVGDGHRVRLLMDDGRVMTVTITE